jgi:sterol desaturase/sphingolipid hydroxylase (fatty acid hydroxylase superfamily)
MGCYSTSFRHLDYIFGTEAGYRSKRQKQAEAKKEAQKAALLKKEGYKTQ